MSNTYFDNKQKNICNGCGVCTLVCPKNCIKMVEDGEGFLYPEIDESKCIKCNKCKRLCGNFNNKTEENEKAYLTINKSEEQLKSSSSGGMFYLLADYIIKKSGVVFGVTYNEKLEAIHDYSENIEDCKKFCGSKYVRSNLGNSYEMVKKFLDEDRYVLFTGTACQISGLKMYLSKNYEKLILCDILCHANPSPKVFKYYIKNLEIIKGKKVKNISFRSKENGWRNQTPIIEYVDGEKEEENTYFTAFVREMINRPSCYSCKFASKRRITDFTIGDFWGYEKIMPEIDETNGISLLNVNSNKGNIIFEELKDKMLYYNVDYDLACSFNHYRNVNVHRNREKFFEKLSAGEINENNIIKYMKKYTKKPLYRKVLGKVKRIIKK
ncbi:MAG: (4Fe-4S)-binding protein [Clostridiales bacterium]|nr:(4Fe-4S)-binding protein [Clostridiales bacterium]